MALRIGFKVYYEGDFSEDEITCDALDRTCPQQTAVYVGYGLLFENDWSLDSDETWAVVVDGIVVRAFGEWEHFLHEREEECDWLEVHRENNGIVAEDE